MKNDLGILVLRLGIGGFMAFSHGLGKLLKFSTIAPKFPDPIGLGSELSLAMAVFAELVCAIAIAVGFKTRWATLPLMFTMLVAAFVVHWADPWSKKEFALLYFIPFLTLFITGAGRYSLDGLLKK